MQFMPLSGCGVLVLYVKGGFCSLFREVCLWGKDRQCETPVSVGLHSRAVCREDVRVG